MRPTIMCSAAALAVCLLLPSCADDAPRPIGAACGAAAQCESNICGGGQCLDPVADFDQDGLINATEAALGTDPASADTDGDGLGDAEEVGDQAAPLDEDLDGKLDAIESAIDDCDEDGLVDQADDTDGTSPTGVCTTSCAARELALTLPPNTATDGELPLGTSDVHAVPVMAGTTYTVRLGPASMESDPNLRIFLSGAALCAHALIADKQGVANADVAAPPHFVSTATGPGASDEFDVVIDDETIPTMYLRVDGASEAPARYVLSTQPFATETPAP